MTMQRARPILWDIYEEHLDEAAFLWGQWEDALVGANYTLDEVAEGPEERLLAHLDGLVLGGKPVAERLLLPALVGEDPGKVAAAAWALVQAEDGDHFETVVAAFPHAAAAARPAIGRALELSHRRDLAARMTALWPQNDEALRGVIFDVVASRDPAWASAALPECIVSREAPLLAAALRALRRAPDPALAGHVEHALHAEDGTVRAEAIATGFVMGVSAVAQACRREALMGTDGSRLSFALLAISPANRDLLVSQLAVPAARRHALWALGFAGDVDAADTVVAALDDEEVARVAGESLSTITGIAIAGSLSRAGVTKGPDVEEIRVDDPPPQVRPEDHLLVPNAEVLAKWWRTARAKLDPKVSYVYGRPRGHDAFHRALASGTMWRRPTLALELGSIARRPVVVDVRAWARFQIRAQPSVARA